MEWIEWWMATAAAIQLVVRRPCSSWTTRPADATWLYIYASNLSAEFLDRLPSLLTPCLQLSSCHQQPSAPGG